MMENILDPKNRWKDKENPSLFEYYAGFSIEFAESVIERYTEAGAMVLDPWNGSGTTTLAATLSGRNSIGIDLNPAALLIAKARLANSAEILEQSESLRKVIRNFRSPRNTVLSDQDILVTWLSNDSAKMLRSFIDKINVFFNSSNPIQIEKVSNCHALVLKIVAETLKTYMAPLKGSNPTWIKISKKSSAEKIVLNKKEFISSVVTAIDKKINSDFSSKYVSKSNYPVLLCKDSRSLDILQRFDLILGSPPYCTRIDYAVKTLPEAAILGISRTYALGEFRQSVLGSTITSDLNIDSAPPIEWGKICSAFLQQVRNHPSKASATYYYKFHYNYYKGLYESIRSAAKLLKSQGYFAIVVQDSYYKEVRNDLPGIVIEMFEKNELDIFLKKDFSNKGSFSLMNSAAGVYGKDKKYIESVIIGKKK